MSNLIYPEHKHPHGVENKPENPERIWVCTEGKTCVFTDTELREDINVGWAHKCKCYPGRKQQMRCESHLEPYLPDTGGVQ